MRASTSVKRPNELSLTSAVGWIEGATLRVLGIRSTILEESCANNAPVGNALMTGPDPGCVKTLLEV